MGATGQAAWETAEEDALFCWLTDAVRTENYTEEYCEKLEAYQSVTANEAAVFYFAARLAFSLDELHEAYRLAHEAYKRRKLSHKIWQLLFQLDDALGFDEEAIFFKALCQQHMDISVGVPRFDNPAYQDSLFKGFLMVQAPPFRFDFAETPDGEQTLLLMSSVGQFLLSEPGTDVSYRYYCGVYNAWDFFHIRANSLDWMKRGGASLLGDYSGFVFDIMKARRMERTAEIQGECILPAAASAENQRLLLREGKTEGSVFLGREEFRFLRLSGETHLESTEPFVMGAPIRLGHSPRRKRLVLNILLDGLSWPAMKLNEFRHIPNLIKFFSKGIIFNNNYSVSEYTFVSLGTIETGMAMHRSQVVWDKPMFTLEKDIVTISEQMKALGYYCVNVMGDGRGIYDGVTRGFDRLIVNPYLAIPAYEGVERTISHLEAFEECDNYVFLHVSDPHPMSSIMVPLSPKTQTHFPWQGMIVQDEEDGVSVRLPFNDVYVYDNPYRIEAMDRVLGQLFAYIEEHYAPEDFIIHAYSDHGSAVYTEDPWYFSEAQCGAALLVRGAGIPQIGFAEELTGNLDIYPIMEKTVGFSAPPGQLDGSLPRAFGGEGRRYAISNSIYPGQTYKLSIRTMEHEFRLESEKPTHHDGTVDMSRFSSHVYTRDAAHREVFDEALHAEFLSLAHSHTASFHERWEEDR